MSGNKPPCWCTCRAFISKWPLGGATWHLFAKDAIVRSVVALAAGRARCWQPAVAAAGSAALAVAAWPVAGQLLEAARQCRWAPQAAEVLLGGPWRDVVQLAALPLSSEAGS